MPEAYKDFYKSVILSLQTQQKEHQINLVLQFFTPFVNTSFIPNTVEFLKAEFPQVLCTKCFNPHNYTFEQEAKATELGHLFEHIFLEKLNVLKLEIKNRRSIFTGLTSWNWREDPRGLFRIRVNAGSEDAGISSMALLESIDLFEHLLIDFALVDATDSIDLQATE